MLSFVWPVREAIAISIAPAPFAKIRLRKKFMKFVYYLELGPWNGSRSSKSVFRTLWASAPFIAERRQPARNGRREGYAVPFWGHSGGEAESGTGF